MNILFLSIGKLDDLSLKALYPDLVRALARKHRVYVATCTSQGTPEPVPVEECGCQVLRIACGYLTSRTLVGKAMSLFTMQGQFLRAILRGYRDVHFDLIIYTTPPISFEKVVRRLKERDHARTYLLLKDIFPQNAVDLGFFSKLNPVYHYYRHQERNLYRISDFIGCMSPGNVRYLLAHNPGIATADRTEVCPNSVEITQEPAASHPEALLAQLGIPQSGVVRYIYGGNLGKPQGIGFVMQLLASMRDDPRAYFVIVGGGSEYARLAAFLEKQQLPNVKLIHELPRDDYQRLADACHVGLIFLDHRFTIPNIPSRMLSYMQAAKPVFAVTDPCTDVKDYIREGNYGWWAPSDNLERVRTVFHTIEQSQKDFPRLGENGRKYLAEHFSVERAAEIILRHFA